jgi:hypothetical protein
MRLKKSSKTTEGGGKKTEGEKATFFVMSPDWIFFYPLKPKKRDILFLALCCRAVKLQEPLPERTPPPPASLPLPSLPNQVGLGLWLGSSNCGSQNEPAFSNCGSQNETAFVNCQRPCTGCWRKRKNVFWPAVESRVSFFLPPPRLVVPCLIHALAGRMFPAGERGSAAGSLLSSHHPKIYLGLRVVQAITQGALSLCLVPRLVNVASCARFIFCPVPATQAVFVS